MGKGTNRNTGSNISRNMESLRAMADIMNEEALNEKDDVRQVSNKPEELNEKKTEKKSSLSKSSGDEVGRLIKYTEELDDDAVPYTSVRVKVSLLELLNELKSIPDFKEYNKGDLLGAALYLFVDRNRELLREMKSKKISAL